MGRLFITDEELCDIMIKALDSSNVMHTHTSVDCVVHTLAQYELSSEVS